MPKDLVIAIDGPAASGKGTLARRLAEHFEIPHLDTGLTYRAVAHALLQVGLPLDQEELAVAVAHNLNLGELDREMLSTHEVGEAASRIAVMSGVRDVLVRSQRGFAAQRGGAVLDGRDIGTVVCPGAPIKFYITASPEIRARRRAKEIGEKGGDVSEAEILSDIRRRDQRDMGREDSPLRPAEDAHLIDTSEMTIETAFAAVMDHVKNSL